MAELRCVMLLDLRCLTTYEPPRDSGTQIIARVRSARPRCHAKLLWEFGLVYFPKILQIFFSDSPLHRIFTRMHEVLNIDKNKN